MTIIITVITGRNVYNKYNDDYVDDAYDDGEYPNDYSMISRKDFNNYNNQNEANDDDNDLDNKKLERYKR